MFNPTEKSKIQKAFYRDFTVDFSADLVFKDFSRKLSIFKHCVNPER